MKIFDCITYYDEPMLFELRLNILSSYVDEFIVVRPHILIAEEKKKLILKKKIFLNLKIK